MQTLLNVKFTGDGGAGGPDRPEETAMRLAFAGAAACLVLAAGGCANDPGSMTRGEVEARLRDELGLASVSLQEQPDGGYSGTGQRADGGRYAITVARKPADRSLWYTATSERGELKAGGLKGSGPPWLRALDRSHKAVMVVMVLFVAAGVVFVVARRLGRRATRAEPDPAADGRGR